MCMTEVQEVKQVETKEDAAKPKNAASQPAGAEAAASEKTEGVVVPKPKKKGKKHVPVGNVYIQATFNNTIITFTDPNGNVVTWASAGSVGFKGSRKNTPFAAQVAAEAAAQKAKEAGMRSVDMFVKGPGGGRESAIRAIQRSGIKVTGIRDITPIPHNGCRPPKRRRV
jgi:small subunit ribosomal protein S11